MYQRAVICRPPAVTQRVPPDLLRRRHRPSWFADFVGGDFLLVGRDAVNDQAVRVDSKTAEQSWARPVQRFADFVVRKRLRIEADNAQPLLPQEHAGREPGDAGADHGDVVVWRGTHTSRVYELARQPK